MESLGGPTYAFGEFVLDTVAPELRRRGVRVELQRKPMDLLVYLARNHERVVPMAEVLDHVWPGVVVSDTAVRSALKAVRSALGDDGRGQQVIRTRKRYGLQLVAPVRPVPPRRGEVVPITVAAQTALAHTGRARWPDGFIERLALFLYRELATPGELGEGAPPPRASGVFLGAAVRLAEALADPPLTAGGRT